MKVYYPRELDTFYISYDEPNREENWAQIQTMLPNAKRMHGVKGFEAAHKACATASTTDRFMTIDGDNWVLDGAFDTQLDDTDMEDVVFSFKSKNAINGLEYGNGGIKCWRKHVLLDSSTHESNNSTDFCWALRYYQVDTLGSNTVNNASAYQAWRAGYREGVKMSYLNGLPMNDPVTDVAKLYQGNRSKLNVWMSVGRDVSNGPWAMLGARQGFCDIYNGNIENTVINDYDWFESKWKTLYHVDLESLLEQYKNRLFSDFNVYVPELAKLDSQWFKNTYLHPKRSGMML